MIATDRIPATMCAVQLTAHGGPEALVYRTDVPVPSPAADEVLIKISAGGVNNTDINTRTGWYAKSVRGETNTAVAVDTDVDGSWDGSGIHFPRIQGADACGRIVAVGADVDQRRIGERVIVATMQTPDVDAPWVTVTLGSEMDGAFAEYMVARASETHAVVSDWTDVELASIPCAYSTAENMLHRVDVTNGQTVLVTGASGGVGSAVVQLARRRGAEVIAVASESKHEAITAIGAERCVARDADLAVEVGSSSIDVVVDLVAGAGWPALLDVLRPGGRLVTSGAIAGPIVELDVRTLYLKDLQLCGATAQSPGVFERLVGYIERNEIRPLVHATFPLADIAEAQRTFGAKQFVGKLVLRVAE